MMYKKKIRALNIVKKNQKKNSKKNVPKKIKKQKFKKKIQKKNFTKKNLNIFSPIKFASYHTHRITLVVSHSHATSGGIWRILVR